MSETQRGGRAQYIYYDSKILDNLDLVRSIPSWLVWTENKCTLTALCMLLCPNSSLTS